jgi:uncharacterized protein
VSDLDGIYSAAIGSIKYPNADLSFHSYGRSDFEEMFNAIIKKINNVDRNGIVIISDLGINSDIEDLCVKMIRRINHMHWDVIWADHHPWSPGVIHLLSEVATIVHDESGKLCAAELLFRYFTPDNKVAKQLSLMAHSMDFMTGNEYLPPVSELIQYYRNLSNWQEKLTVLACKSATGILWDTEMQRDYLRYLTICNREKNKALSSILVKHIAGFDVAFLPISGYIQTSLFAKEVFDATATDLALFYTKNGKVSIRRNNNRISCRVIASSLVEGGGHDFAAGGKLIISSRKSNDFVTELERLVTRVLRQTDNG